MPELPEVENFRRLLLPLVSKEHPLVLERCSLEKAPPRKFITDEEISEIQDHKLVVTDVLRKGKLICMLLKEKRRTKGNIKEENRATKYLFLHMGMTGRISNPECIPKLKELSDTEIYPPPYTYLRLVAGPNEASYSDPRKFGAVYLKDVLEEDFDILAPDAWTSIRPRQIKSETTSFEKGDRQGAEDESKIIDIVLAKLTEQSMGIKGVLLDQKRAICGVGNWVADEVLYQTKMHPDQNYLTKEEAKALLDRLHIILDQAVQCLYKDQEFPLDWLFHYRWSKRRSKKTTVKDAHGRFIVFVTSGGRTSAVVPSIQKKASRKLKTTTTTPRKEQKKTKRSEKEKESVMSTTVSKLPATLSEAISEKSAKKVKLTKKEKTTNMNHTKKESGRKNDAPRPVRVVGINRETRRSSRLAKL
jgi:formamidopyrimidine-DNA glycosylase